MKQMNTKKGKEQFQRSFEKKMLADVDMFSRIVVTVAYFLNDSVMHCPDTLDNDVRVLNVSPTTQSLEAQTVLAA